MEIYTRMATAAKGALRWPAAGQGRRPDGIGAALAVLSPRSLRTVSDLRVRLRSFSSNRAVREMDERILTGT
jgi:hypothetical protein